MLSGSASREKMMKMSLCVLILALASLPALARKNCDELKAEIEAKIQSHGVKSFTLEIVDKGKGGDLRIVGSCDAGSKEITYKKP